MNYKRNLLKNMMSLDFILTELCLYLNSHPDDKRALLMHKEIREKAEDARKMYEKAYGPIVSNGNNSSETWEWVKGPWPWENR